MVRELYTTPDGLVLKAHKGSFEEPEETVYAAVDTGSIRRSLKKEVWLCLSDGEREYLWDIMETTHKNGYRLHTSLALQRMRCADRGTRIENHRGKRQARIASWEHLSTLLQPGPLFTRLWSAVSESWRAHARHHKRNHRWHVHGEDQCPQRIE